MCLLGPMSMSMCVCVCVCVCAGGGEAATVQCVRHKVRAPNPSCRPREVIASSGHAAPAICNDELNFAQLFAASGPGEIEPHDGMGTVPHFHPPDTETDSSSFCSWEDDGHRDEEREWECSSGSEGGAVWRR